MMRLAAEAALEAADERLCAHAAIAARADYEHAALRQLTVRLPEELGEALRNYAFVTDTSANDVIKAALTEYLKAHAHTDIVRAAFDKALSQHEVAFEKLEHL